MDQSAGEDTHRVESRGLSRLTAGLLQGLLGELPLGDIEMHDHGPARGVLERCGSQREPALAIWSMTRVLAHEIR